MSVPLVNLKRQVVQVLDKTKHRNSTNSTSSIYSSPLIIEFHFSKAESSFFSWFEAIYLWNCKIAWKMCPFRPDFKKKLQLLGAVGPQTPNEGVALDPSGGLAPPWTPAPVDFLVTVRHWSARPWRRRDEGGRGSARPWRHGMLLE